MQFYAQKGGKEINPSRLAVSAQFSYKKPLREVK